MILVSKLVIIISQMGIIKIKLIEFDQIFTHLLKNKMGNYLNTIDDDIRNDDNIIEITISMMEYEKAVFLTTL